MASSHVVGRRRYHEMTDAEKRAARATRFANDEKNGPPPMPVRKHAWPGGKLVSNKEEAVRKFLERKAKEAVTQASLYVSKPIEDEDETEIYVGNLPYKTKSEALASVFEGCTSARIVRERGKSRGYGFVSFRSESLALAALSLNGKTELLGRKLNVRPARHRLDAKGSVAAALEKCHSSAVHLP